MKRIATYSSKENEMAKPGNIDRIKIDVRTDEPAKPGEIDRIACDVTLDDIVKSYETIREAVRDLSAKRAQNEDRIIDDDDRHEIGGVGSLLRSMSRLHDIAHHRQSVARGVACDGDGTSEERDEWMAQLGTSAMYDLTYGYKRNGIKGHVTLLLAYAMMLDLRDDPDAIIRRIADDIDAVVASSLLYDIDGVREFESYRVEKLMAMTPTPYTEADIERTVTGIVETQPYIGTDGSRIPMFGDTQLDTFRKLMRRGMGMSSTYELLCRAVADWVRFADEIGPTGSEFVSGYGMCDEGIVMAEQDADGIVRQIAIVNGLIGAGREESWQEVALERHPFDCC